MRSRSIPILTYHQIDLAPAKGTPMRSLYVSPAAFARQMAWLKCLGFQGLSMSALMPYLRGEKFGRVVGITFDDGYANNLRHALPVLQQYGFSSTCYIVSQRVGQTNVWDADLGVPSAALMDWDALRAWQAGGQEIGSHTQTHANLKTLTDVDAQREIADSKTDLETQLGTPVTQFCYPFGIYGPEHAQAARCAGYEAATTTLRGRVAVTPSSAQLFDLPRVPVVRSTYWPQFLLKLLTAYEDSH
jgi:peptidoglycan/xylan/chitin deacetylase (PgdA/CDA1 family)